MSDLFNEAVLKLTSLAIRFGQLSFSLSIIGCISQFLTTLSDRGVSVPKSHVAVAAMSGITTLWSAIALLTTLCAGKIMLEVETTMDVLAVGMSIAEAALLTDDALCSIHEFIERYRMAVMVGALPSRGLARACFALAIVNIALFAGTSLMSWVVVLIRRRHEQREKYAHEHEHGHHHHDHHGHHYP